MRTNVPLLVFILLFLGGVRAQNVALARKTQGENSTVSLDIALKKLESKFNVYFNYDEASVKNKYIKTESINNMGENVDVILKQFLNPLSLSFKKVKDNYYIIFQEDSNEEIKKIKSQGGSSSIQENKEELSQLKSYGSSIKPMQMVATTIQGTVTSKEDNTPLPGVNVLIKGTSLGTITDMNGKYSINVPDENAVLVFSFIGFTTEEVAVGNQGVINVSLVADIKSLQEVVVVGYGTQQKSQVTGAISSVSSAEIQAVPVISADQALQGRAAGVDVIASGHAPGATATVRIRGINSINANNDPLFVVDGIPISGGLNDINPNVIESMEVLKDASATAIYGARGSNGVVLITTKRGKEGKTQITYDGYAGISRILNKVEVLDAAGWVRYKEASRRSTDLSVLLDPIELENYQNGEEVDWQDLNLRDGFQQSHSIGALGGNQKTQFSISANYLEQKGIVYSSDFQRGSIQINLDHQISDRFKIGTSTLLSTSKSNIINSGQVLGQAMRISPLGDIYNDDGTLRLFPTNEALLGNPLTDAQNEKNQQFRSRIFSSLFAEYEILKGLKYRLNFGPDLTFGNNGRFIGSYTNTLQGAPNRASNSKFETKAYTVENLLMFNRTFNSIHDLGVTLLQSVQEQSYEVNSVEAMGMPSETMLWHDLSAGQIRSFDSNQEQWSILSFMARLNYTLKGKYMMTLTARRDGSSRFGEDNKYGFFPSAALGWRIAEEDFMKNVSVISDLKLRASYGSIGNTAIDPYQSMGSLSRLAYLFGSEPALGFQPSTLPNPDLKWEISQSANIGLDFGLFSNRISGSLEYYQINNKDLLLNQALATSTGYDKILTNIGSTRNSGVEASFSTINLDLSNGFKWTTDLNFAINKNEIVELYGDDKDDVGSRWFIGEPINVYYDLVFDGIWQEDEAEQAKVYGRLPGQVKVKDVNNDNKITAEDREILGSPIPKWTGGITNHFKYKGFDLSVFVNTRQNFMIDSEVHDLGALEGRYNIPTFVNYYTPENPSNDYPRPVMQGDRNIDMYVLRYREGSFVRVRNINLGYNFSEGLLGRTGVQSLRLYVNVQNPFTFTKYEGWDPESATGISSYPSTKLFLIGVNASF